MSIFSLFLFAFWFLVAFITPCLAETNKLFQWAFKDTSISSELPTCTAFSIVVKSFDPTTNATQGTPPYYMISFPVGGTPVTTFIGTDENNLSWTVTQPINSQLLLSVVDANGSAGGIPPQFLTVIRESISPCITTPLDTPAFTVSSNVTGSLETCAPWGVTVKGGSPPYVITLAQINSPVVTNVTMPFGTDRFTFINRADPGEQLIAKADGLPGRQSSTPQVQPTLTASALSVPAATRP
ncbi:hypothetical protein BDZ97DRAFT_1411532 [Flammula alnicola]|nr:hypothetical protein BDZ97DRAFT_1411532 [Flammula alnicola]